MKKIFIVVFVFLAIVAALVYMYRYEIFQVSAETLIRQNLPPYVTVDTIVFDLEGKKLEITGLGIKGPAGYRSAYLAEIGKVTGRYKMRGKALLDGIEVTEITAERPVINIERLPSGRININEMDKVLSQGTAAPANPVKKSPGKTAGIAKQVPRITISDLVKLTDTINLVNGQIVFLDGFSAEPPRRLTFDAINGVITLRLNDSYTGVISVGTKGGGTVNGDGSQSMEWEVLLDPASKELHMSNTYNIRNVDITTFKPYYDSYSPIDVKRGRCSGKMVINFSDGDIGSDNIFYLKGLEFSVKPGQTGGEYWSGAIGDIIKYLSSSTGEIVFDFKIKGPVRNPRFYPGPNVRNAIQNMVVDKISETIKGLSGDGGQTPGGGEQSDAEKVIDIMQGLFKR
ncbi:MAG: DUF748 domain-containing protein [Candidatus Omnitrophota bacterium]